MHAWRTQELCSGTTAVCNTASKYLGVRGSGCMLRLRDKPASHISSLMRFAVWGAACVAACHQQPQQAIAAYSGHQCGSDCGYGRSANVARTADSHRAMLGEQRPKFAGGCPRCLVQGSPTI